MDLDNLTEAAAAEGIMINSGDYTGMNNKDAIRKITADLEAAGKGKKTINYTKTRICVECTSCDSLPEKYRAAADKALRSDESFSSKDLNDQNVEVYTIEDGLPLADVNDLPEEYRKMASRVTCTYFQVLVYDQDHKVFMFWFDYR